MVGDMRLTVERVPRMLAASEFCPECGASGFAHAAKHHHCVRCGLDVVVE